MPKFITTKEHPIFKEGIAFKMGNDTFDLFAFSIKGISDKMLDVIKESDLEIWLNEGYIKEVQEPKYTENEAKEMCIDFACFSSNSELIGVSGSYGDWLKQRDK